MQLFVLNNVLENLGKSIKAVGVLEKLCAGMVVSSAEMRCERRLLGAKEVD